MPRKTCFATDVLRFSFLPLRVIAQHAGVHYTCIMEKTLSGNNEMNIG